MRFDLQIPFNYEDEWEKALPVISDKKRKEINKAMNQASKSRGWSFYGFSNSHFFFVKYIKVMAEDGYAIPYKRTFTEYRQMDRTTGLVSSDAEDAVDIYNCKEVKKFLDPMTNEVMYANMCPTQVMRFYGVTKDIFIEKTYNMNIEDKLNEATT